MNLFKNYQDDEQNLGFVYEQINNRNFTILPSSIATGPVFKITYDGNLEEDLYERGFLVIPKGSSINSHLHTSDIEQYTLLTGTLSINGVSMNINECLIGESHSIDPVPELTIIKTIKISNKKLNKGPIRLYTKLK